jgi:hypothetical protein
LKALKVILWICGIGFMISFIFMLLPWSIIESLYRFFGEEPIPNIPTANYLFRISCALVGLIGIYFIILAQNPSHYRQLLIFSAVGLMACGVICVIVGLIVGISPSFLIGDGLFGIVLGIILASLIPKAEAQKQL